MHVCFGAHNGSKSDIAPYPLSNSNGLNAPQQIKRLFDHLVGTREQSWWNFHAERRRGFYIYDQLVLGRRLHRKFGWVLALEDAVDISSSKSIWAVKFGSVRDQAASGDKIIVRVDCGQFVPSSQLSEQCCMIRAERARSKYEPAIRALRES